MRMENNYVSQTPRGRPQEVVAPPADKPAYDRVREQDVLQVPYRLPRKYLEGIIPDPTGVSEAPLIVFINAKSGGRQGSDLTLALFRALGRAQVFDVFEHPPDKVLSKLWENINKQTADGDTSAREYLQRLRILVAGGDGSIAWILSIIKKLNLQPPPPVAIMPLGTGNDLSRSFGWGPAFTKTWIKGWGNIYDTLNRLRVGAVEDLDRWRVTVHLPDKKLQREMPHSIRPVEPSSAASQHSNSTHLPSRLHHSSSAGLDTRQLESQSLGPSVAEGGSGVLLEGMFWNYFSVGLDAKAAWGFHDLRQRKPHLAAGRMMNQFWYSWFSCTSGWFCCTKPLRTKVSLEVLKPGTSQWEALAIPENVRALVVLNLQSYAGGRNLWGDGDVTAAEEQQGLRKPKFNDGLLEVVGLTNGYHTGSVMATKGGLVHAKRICQTSGLRLSLKASYSRPDGMPSHCYLQVDGEPWIQDVPSDKGGPPVVIEVRNAGVSRMLHNYQGLGPVVHGGRNQMGQRTMPIPQAIVQAQYEAPTGSLAVDSCITEMGSVQPSSVSTRTTEMGNMHKHSTGGSVMSGGTS